MNTVKYYTSERQDTVWMLTKTGMMVCIASDRWCRHEVGNTHAKPIFPGSWRLLEGSIEMADIIESWVEK